MHIRELGMGICDHIGGKEEAGKIAPVGGVVENGLLKDIGPPKFDFARAWEEVFLHVGRNCDDADV